MNELTIFNHEGKFVTDSREVAEMVGKQHAHLLRDIQGYIGAMRTNPELDSLNFFILNTYSDGKGEARPRYLITKKGCDMVANKMTGEKGIIFTALYVTKFEEMERNISKPALPQTYAEALRQLADQVEENERLLPKAEMHDMFLSAENTQTIGDVAKALKTGRTRLFNFLRDQKILRANNTPYQTYIERGYFKVIEKSISMGGEVINKPQTLVTAKGVDYIAKKLKEVS